jgi:hypothetical protein
MQGENATNASQHADLLNKPCFSCDFTIQDKNQFQLTMLPLTPSSWAIPWSFIDVFLAAGIPSDRDNGNGTVKFSGSFPSSYFLGSGESV